MEKSNLNTIEFLVFAEQYKQHTIEEIFVHLGIEISNAEQIEMERLLVKHGLVNFINHSHKGSYFELNQYGKGLSLLLLKERTTSHLN